MPRSLLQAESLVLSQIRICIWQDCRASLGCRRRRRRLLSL